MFFQNHFKKKSVVEYGRNCIIFCITIKGVFQQTEKSKQTTCFGMGKNS